LENKRTRILTTSYVNEYWHLKGDKRPTSLLIVPAIGTTQIQNQDCILLTNRNFRLGDTLTHVYIHVLTIHLSGGNIFVFISRQCVKFLCGVLLEISTFTMSKYITNTKLKIKLMRPSSMYTGNMGDRLAKVYDF